VDATGAAAPTAASLEAGHQQAAAGLEEQVGVNVAKHHAQGKPKTNTAGVGKTKKMAAVKGDPFPILINYLSSPTGLAALTNSLTSPLREQSHYASKSG
jgi:hypothetical protein